MPELSWNAALYNHQHDFVSQYGTGVIDWLQPAAGEHILDVGCGTGTLANEIAGFGTTVTGIDAAESMIELAKASFPKLTFLVKDATDFSFDHPFDAVFSNAALHWINDQESALQCIYHSLRKGGRFVFEMGAQHNIENIHNAVKTAITEAGFGDRLPRQTNYFPSAGEQASLLEKVGFTIADLTCFKRVTPLKGEDAMKQWINQFCGFFFTAIPETNIEAITGKAVELLRTTNYKDGTWYGDYVRLRVRAIKE